MRRSSFVRALLGALALGLALSVATSAPARTGMSRPPLTADDFPGVSVGVTPLFDADGSSGVACSTWTEVVVSITSRDVALQGHLDIIATRPSEAPRVESRHVVSIGRGEHVRLQVPVEANGANHSAALYADAADVRGAVAVDDIRIVGPRAAVMLTAGVPAHGPFDVHMCRECAALSEVSVRGALPHRAASYDNVRLFAMERARIAASSPNGAWFKSGPPLGEAECSALREWLETGGTLLLVHDERARETPDPALSLRCGLGDAPPPTPGITQRRFGEGRIAFASSSLVGDRDGASPIASLLYQASHSRATPYAFVDPARFGRLRSGRWLAAVGLSTFGFCVLSGPVLFAALRRRRKTERALTLLPLASLATFALLLGLAAFARPQRGVATVAFLDFVSGRRQGRATVARGFLRPDGVVRVAPVMSGADAHIESIEDLDGRGRTRMDSDGSIVLNETNPSTDFVYVVESGRQELAGPISIACSRDACTVQNDSGSELLGARLVVPRRGYADVGRIAEGARVAVKLAKLRDVAELDEQDDPIVADAPFDASGPVSLVAIQRPAGTFERRVRVTCAADCEVAR